jgi:hypothetical protein
MYGLKTSRGGRDAAAGYRRTGRDHVLPSGLAAAGAQDDVIEGASLGGFMLRSYLLREAEKGHE